MTTSLPRPAVASEAPPSSRVLIRLLGDTWTIPCVHGLAKHDVMAFGELRRYTGASARMLTRTLKRLERAGVVSRAVVSKRPLRVEYRLTPLGQTLDAPLRVLCDWVRDRGEALEAGWARSG